MAFSDNLQFIRAQAGVTQEQLAEQLNVSRQQVDEAVQAVKKYYK